MGFRSSKTIFNRVDRGWGLLKKEAKWRDGAAIIPLSLILSLSVPLKAPDFRCLYLGLAYSVPTELAGMRGI